MATVGHAIKHGVSPAVLARFLVLGMPGGVMMAADAASFDVTTVMASVLGIAALVLNDICQPYTHACCSIQSV